MKITEKDKTFLENLKNLMASKDLWVELKLGRPSYMVLKGTYGEKIHKTFRMTRQGVRWRFYRLFNCVYVEAFLTILMIEKTWAVISIEPYWKNVIGSATCKPGSPSSLQQFVRVKIAPGQSYLGGRAIRSSTLGGGTPV